ESKGVRTASPAILELAALTSAISGNFPLMVLSAITMAHLLLLVCRTRPIHQARSRRDSHAWRNFAKIDQRKGEPWGGTGQSMAGTMSRRATSSAIRCAIISFP